MADPFVVGLVAASLLIFLGLLLRALWAPKRSVPAVLIDGSNVMHWLNDKPQIAPVKATVDELTGRGLVPGVIFDANAGYKLSGRYMNEQDFARLLGLRAEQVFVVPKGTQADPYLLSAAREYGAKVVTRDRFRDWAKDYPEVTAPGFLMRGGYRSTGVFWLDEATPSLALA